MKTTQAKSSNIVTINKNPAARQMRDFVRTQFGARVKKDDDGQYSMVMKRNSVSLHVANNSEKLKARLEEVCGAPHMIAHGVVVYDFQGIGRVSLASGDDDFDTLTLINRLN